MKKDEELVLIRTEADIVTARRQGREVAARLGFASIDRALIATAISELARNIVLYAGRGEIALGPIEDGSRRGIAVVARDKGPGISRVDEAMRDGFSTSGGLGLGLPGVRRLMDEIAISTHVGKGTVVTAKKWLR